MRGPCFQVICNALCVIANAVHVSLAARMQSFVDAGVLLVAVGHALHLDEKVSRVAACQ